MAFATRDVDNGGSMKMRKVALMVAGAALAAGAVPALAGTPLSGNTQGIKLAHAVLRAMARPRVETYRETGFAVMVSSEGKTSTFLWRWGTGHVPRGWVKATEHGVVWLNRGRVTAWLDALTPPRCTVGLCSEVPVVMTFNRHGRYYAFGTPAAHTCFGKLGGSTPFVYGTAPYGIVGKVSAPVRSGSATKLTYAYTFGHQLATETDVVSNATSRVTSGRVRISKAGSAPAFAFTFHYAYPGHGPKPPHIVLCHG